MNKSAVIASFFTVLIVLGVVAYRLLWAASSVASAAGLGRLRKLPKSWRRRLFDARNDAPSESSIGLSGLQGSADFYVRLIRCASKPWG